MKSRLTQRIGLVCLILSVAATDAVATSVQVDNGDILTTDLIESIVIDNNIIKVTTNTANPWNIVQQVGNPTPVVNLLANNQSVIQIPLGENVTISWDVSNSTSCDTTGGTAAWAGLTITPDGQGNSSGSIQILVDFETATDFNLECSDDSANTASDAVTVTGTNDVPDPVVTLLVGNATSVEVDSGTDTQLSFSWNVSNAESCVTSLGNSAWQAVNITPVNGSASSSTSITVNLTNATTFRLSCTGGGPTPVEVSDDVTVTINASACPANFVAPLATDLTPNQRDNLLKTWGDIFGSGFSWPFPQFASRDLIIPRSRYLAIEFNTGNNTGLDGGVKTITDTRTEGTRFGSISKCPGDFSQHLAAPSSCTKQWFIGGALNWTTGSSAASWECQLQPNTTYYLNLTFTDGVSTTSDTCAGFACYTELEVWHF